MSLSSSLTQHTGQSTQAAFNRVHLAVFLACWIPLNPIIVEAVRNPHFTLSNSSLFGILGSICGPLAPRLFDPQATLHPELILVAATILGASILAQLVWRPAHKGLALVRQLIWAAGWWLWFASAFVSFLANA